MSDFDFHFVDKVHRLVQSSSLNCSFKNISDDTGTIKKLANAASEIFIVYYNNLF